MRNRIQLSDHFTYGRLLRFVLPSIVMMIFTSVYGVVDGLFVSNFAGKTAFASINLIWPLPMIFGSAGFMLGTGGCAIVAKTLGEGKSAKANEYFSLLIYVTAAVGVLFAVIGFFITGPVAKLIGADEEQLKYCVVYGRILFSALPFFMLQSAFQEFMVTAEKPTLGLFFTVAAGVTNIIFDFVFVGLLHGGVIGAGFATALSQFVGGVVPVLYFARRNDSLLHLTKTHFSRRVLTNASLNGSSELMTNISLSLVNMLYNYQLMRLAGEDGVAAYGVIMYVNFIFVSSFIGYSVGSAPVVSYNYGANTTDELKNVFKKSMVIIAVSGIAMTVLAVMLSGVLSKIFVGYDAGLYEMTRHGFIIYSLSFLVLGFNIFGSSFFTALGNGPVSALISFLRTLLFEIISVLLLPVFFGTDGVWMAIVVSETAALIITAAFIIQQRKKYNYM